MKGDYVFMRSYKKVMTIIAEVLNVIAIISLIFMMCMVISDIVMRNVFSKPIVGATEMVQMSMVCLVPAFVSALIGGQHVSVGIFVDNMSRKAQLLFDTIGHLLGAGVCGLIAYQTFKNMQFAIKFNESYSMLKLPKWPLLLLFSITFAVMVPAILAVFISKFVDKDAYALCKGEKKKVEGEQNE